MAGSPSGVIGRIPGIDSVGSLPATAGLKVLEAGGDGPIRHTRVYFTNLALTLADNGTNGSGGTKFYTFPEGQIILLRGKANVVITYGTVTDANLLSAVGTVTAAADGALTSTEANLIASTATASTSGAGTFQGTGITAASIDGTATAAALFINMATSTDPSTNNTITLTGYIDFQWTLLGDD